MQLTFSQNILTAPTDALLVMVRPDAVVAEPAIAGYLERLKALTGFKSAADDVEVIFPVEGLGCQRLVIVGLGDEPLSLAHWRQAIATGYKAVTGKATTMGVMVPTEADSTALAACTVETVMSLNYRFHPYQTKAENAEKTLTQLFLPYASASEHAQCATDAHALATVVNHARDLSNMPGNQLTVPELLKAIEALAQARQLPMTRLDAADLAATGLHLLLGVGRASMHPPALAVLEYRGAAPDKAPIALVGKGLTFDTGGICIKPRAGMEEMKTDMHGVATVLGTIAVAAARRLPVNLVAVMPLAENMPGGNALKPGDILRAYDGQTVEVIDTDAEGRLVLADAIAWVVKHHAPETIIDVATLTGSMITTLGFEATGLFASDDQLANDLIAAGERTGERLWRMPIWPAYEGHIKSDIADWRNAAKVKGDAIAAAAFLKQFTGKTRWAHLDIAGPSYLPEARHHLPKASTGVGIRLLIDWLIQTH